jgi:hypothetical protein
MPSHKGFLFFFGKEKGHTQVSKAYLAGFTRKGEPKGRGEEK